MSDNYYGFIGKAVSLNKQGSRNITAISDSIIEKAVGQLGMTKVKGNLIEKNGHFVYVLGCKNRPDGLTWTVDKLIDEKEYDSSGFTILLTCDFGVGCKLWAVSRADFLKNNPSSVEYEGRKYYTFSENLLEKILGTKDSVLYSFNDNDFNSVSGFLKTL